MHDAAHPLHVWLAMLFFDTLRYAVPVFGAYLFFWVLGRERFRAHLVQGIYPRVGKLIHDFKWSLSTIVIFSIVGVFVFYAGRAGILRWDASLREHGVVWFLFSIPLLIVLQDTYFYWTHRAMHHPRLYRVFHRVHHMSTNPSPFTAYAFAPAEALVHAAFVPLVWLVVPLHEAAVTIFLLYMIARNVLGHLSIELFPKGFTEHRLLGLSTTTTHHGLHHEDFRSNYGLYFTYWDRLMGTTHRDYHARFEAVAGGLEKLGKQGSGELQARPEEASRHT